ncbi:MAG: hypothetical protein ABIO71_13685, partial [Caldimonas sp.]
MSLLDILQQYAGGTAAPQGQIDQHFDEVARQASPADLGSGVAAALRSDATPPFGSLISDLFGRSSGQQQAGLLNQLVQALGPAALASVGSGALGRILGGMGTSPHTITAEQASRVSPADVE